MFRHSGTELSECTGKPMTTSGRGPPAARHHRYTCSCIGDGPSQLTSAPIATVSWDLTTPARALICVWMCSNVNHFLIFWKTQGFPHSVGGFETAGLIPRPQRPITSQRLLISASLTLRGDHSPGVAVSSTSLQLPCVPHTLSSVRLLGAFPTTLFLAWLDDAKGTVGVTACPPFMVVPPPFHLLQEEKWQCRF